MMKTDPEAQMASMSANLEANTGRSLEQWTRIALNGGRQKSLRDVDAELLKWLKQAYQQT
jgi:hypothetical protein